MTVSSTIKRSHFCVNPQKHHFPPHHLFAFLKDIDKHRDDRDHFTNRSEDVLPLVVFARVCLRCRDEQWGGEEQHESDIEADVQPESKENEGIA